MAASEARAERRNRSTHKFPGFQYLVSNSSRIFSHSSSEARQNPQRLRVETATVEARPPPQVAAMIIDWTCSAVRPRPRWDPPLSGMPARRGHKRTALGIIDQAACCDGPVARFQVDNATSIALGTAMSLVDAPSHRLDVLDVIMQIMSFVQPVRIVIRHRDAPPAERRVEGPQSRSPHVADSARSRTASSESPLCGCRTSDIIAFPERAAVHRPLGAAARIVGGNLRPALGGKACPTWRESFARRGPAKIDRVRARGRR